MKRSTISNISAAGFSIRLIFTDQKLAKTVNLPFKRSPARSPADAAITIFPSRKSPKTTRLPASTGTFSGEGEYDCLFNIRKKRGYLILTGRHKDIILANFLTRIFAILVTEKQGLMIHGACVIKDNNAYIFHGISGAGKSTACRFSRGCAIASDDITAVRKIGRRYMAWGIPQLGRFPIPENQGPCPIAGFFKLIKDRNPSVTRVSGAAAAAGILALSKNQFDTENISKMLELLDNLADHVPCYELRFRKDASFWDCIDKIKGAT